MGKTGTTQTSQQSQTNMGPWDKQQPYLTKLFSEAEGLYNKGPLQYYPDSTVAGLTPAQNSGYQSSLQQSNALQPAVGAQTQGLTDTLNGKYLDPSSNPYLAKTYGQAADAVTRQYQTATAPGTAAAFSAAGRYGSGARNQQIDQNNRQLGTTLDNLATNIYGGNYQQERQNQLNTMGNFGNIAQGSYVPSQMTTGVGAAQQQQNQAELGDKVNRFNFNQMSPWQTLQLYQNATAGNYGQSGSSSMIGQQPYYSNPIGQGIGGLASLASIGGNLASIFSDVRLKENIVPVGQTFGGLGVYAYNYKGDPRRQIGLMAQEVEQTRPDAVREHESGFKMVDYGKALSDA